MLARSHITQGMFTKLFDLLEASCHEWDLKLAYHYQRVSSSTFTTYSAQLQRLQAAKSELEVAKHSKETTEQLATYMVLLYGEQSNVVTQYLLQQAEEQRESVDKLVSITAIQQKLIKVTIAGGRNCSHYR